MGKKTVMSRLFMVRGGTLKMRPSSSGPQTFLNRLSLTRVRYSQMRSRCQFHCRRLTGSRIDQASWTKACKESWGVASAEEEDLRGDGLADFLGMVVPSWLRVNPYYTLCANNALCPKSNLHH